MRRPRPSAMSFALWSERGEVRAPPSPTAVSRRPRFPSPLGLLERNL
jgi:hypothetical protein